MYVRNHRLIIYPFCRVLFGVHLLVDDDDNGDALPEVGWFVESKGTWYVYPRTVTMLMY